ncbi:cell surface protein [Lactiplantibacillus plantarum]|nr:cell surface protein [Lactiplantibacillus plantarum]
MKLKPRQTQTVAVKIHNTASAPITINIGIAKATTNINGVVEYKHTNNRSANLSYDISKLVTTDEPQVNLRGTSAGWTLTVAQGQQFNTDEEDAGSALTNAALTVAGTESDSAVTNGSTTLTPGTTSAAGAAGTVASANNGTGNGASTVTFSDSKLAVPGKTTKLATGYTTTLTWNLSATPEN